jgi:uncharacterized cupin superfamily protein
VPEARIDETEYGRVPKGGGWYILNARDARWYHADGRSARCDFEGDAGFEQFGINIQVLEPGVRMAMYHREADQEDFLVLAGEALTIVEGEERPLRQWDFFHCPPNTGHTVIGAGSAPCVVVAVGARQHAGQPDWGVYPVDETAQRHGVGVERETSDPLEAYAGLTPREPMPYREGWLPG